VEWEYAPSVGKALAKLKIKNEKLKIICAEQDTASIPYTQMKVEFPVAVVVGNETYGVSKEVLKMADQIVEIPMFGVNKSLNVMVSCALVLFQIINGLRI
jgi:tRNA G18 (ribose-2'-O)-methylase SpoU